MGLENRGTHHIPRSELGCTIFVKLWQFVPEDQEQFAIDLNSLDLTSDPDRPGVSRAVLADRDYERVALERWAPGTERTLEEEGGAEILVLDGTLDHNGETYAKHDWLRFPSGESAQLEAGPEGVRFWIKRGHLASITVPGS